eukprot:380666-Hanusia_phi.AAC.1
MIFDDLKFKTFIGNALKIKIIFGCTLPRRKRSPRVTVESLEMAWSLMINAEGELAITVTSVGD